MYSQNINEVNNMNERIKLIRKHYNLSQTAFGAQIGVTLGVIKNLEQGKTTLSSPLFELLCSIYKVNSDWLRTGEGEMLQQPDNSIVNTIIQDQSLSPAAIQIIENFLSLSQNEQNEFIELAQKVFDIENN